MEPLSHRCGCYEPDLGCLSWDDSDATHFGQSLAVIHAHMASKPSLVLSHDYRFIWFHTAVGQNPLPILVDIWQLLNTEVLQYWNYLTPTDESPTYIAWRATTHSPPTVTKILWGPGLGRYGGLSGKPPAKIPAKCLAARHVPRCGTSPKTNSQRIASFQNIQL